MTLANRMFLDGFPKRQGLEGPHVVDFPDHGFLKRQGPPVKLKQKIYNLKFLMHGCKSTGVS